ncbi:polyprenol monophosphomannose synthase [Bifidobacterium xylocopae]|uniref:Dolichol-phosphate mannosyltransferase n=1 Tax=Bifidobacterium xylocopae TaxID=2493119 RepID=A0A366KBZ8_9BIFI|nr:polyprenol monophosphomannose synthase [Bifidobacterium xylocopae]RBP99250.1 dolichol-phosphate mannosyltransferase [Bifidobacterium xylocopae]
MPTYNEAGTIGRTVGQVLEACPDISIVVVDDGSPDGTGRLADSIAAGDRRVHVMHREGPRGLGPAYLAGFAWGLERGFAVICEMDMDGSHRPQDLPRLLALLDRRPQVALVLGSRRVSGGATAGWPWYRDLISRLGSWYARHALGIRVRDATAGFRAYRSWALRRVDLGSVESSGYVFQIDMLRRILAAGGIVVELPIVFVERTQGVSKMGPSIVLEAMVRVTGWGLERVRGCFGRGPAGR